MSNKKTSTSTQDAPTTSETGPVSPFLTPSPLQRGCLDSDKVRTVQDVPTVVDEPADATADAPRKP